MDVLDDHCKAVATKAISTGCLRGIYQKSCTRTTLAGTSEDGVGLVESTLMPAACTQSTRGDKSAIPASYELR